MAIGVFEEEPFLFFFYSYSARFSLHSVYDLCVMWGGNARAQFLKCACSVPGVRALTFRNARAQFATEPYYFQHQIVIETRPTRSPDFSSSQSRFFQFKVWFSVLSMARVFEGVGTVDGFHASFEPLAAAKLRHRTAKSDTILPRLTIFFG